MKLNLNQYVTSEATEQLIKKTELQKLDKYGKSIERILNKKTYEVISKGTLTPGSKTA